MLSNISFEEVFGDIQERKRPARKKIWEVRPGLRCSIIGTCLTLGELRKIANRAGSIEGSHRLTDFDLHGLAVGKMDSENALSAAAQKHLDAKFEGAIRKAKSLESDDEFSAFWEAAVDAGLVPGAYWALMTHPALSSDAEVRIYGETHMMSHVCGASNRGDARAIAEAERAKAGLARRLSARIAERDRQLREQKANVERLAKRVHELEKVAEKFDRLPQLPNQDQLAARLAKCERERASLSEKNAALSRSCRGFEFQIERLQTRLLNNQWQGRCLSSQSIAAPVLNDHTDLLECDAGKLCNLCGRCVLYVGGRPQTVCKLREWVSNHNGALLHHDGGIEHSPGMLGDLVRRADIVLFPVDCVSHGAAGTVKKLCENYGKHMCPLRTASVSAFRRAIGGLMATSQLQSRTLETQ